jgi:hypothetical protein
MVGADHHAAHRRREARQAIARSTPDAAVLVSRLDEFLAQASAALTEAPALEGELRWSYGYTWTLQGVHGTRSGLKRRHSLAELALERTAEPLAALALARGAGDLRPILAEARRTLLRSQFHDSIAGCTDPVARVEARSRTPPRSRPHRAGRSTRSSGTIRTGRGNGHGRRRSRWWRGNQARRRGVAIADLTWFRRDVSVGPPGSRAPEWAVPVQRRHRRRARGLPFQPLGRALGRSGLTRRTTTPTRTRSRSPGAVPSTGRGRDLSPRNGGGRRAAVGGGAAGRV